VSWILPEFENALDRTSVSDARGFIENRGTVTGKIEDLAKRFEPGERKDGKSASDPKSNSEGMNRPLADRLTVAVGVWLCVVVGVMLTVGVGLWLRVAVGVMLKVGVGIWLLVALGGWVLGGDGICEGDGWQS
jgi:Flp pilus assembly protein TadB